MTIPSHDVRGALHTTLDLISLNRRQHDLLFNPDRRINSLAERIIHLRHYGVSPEHIRQLIGDVRKLLELNAAEGEGARTVAGQLDEFATALAHVERNHNIVAGESTKRVAAQLRKPLRVIRRPQDYDGVEFFKAAAAINDIVASCPRSRLLSPTMRRQLGDGPHDKLLELLEARS